MGLPASRARAPRREAARRRRLDRRALDEEFRAGDRPRGLGRLAALARDVAALEQARTASRGR
jgi:hypothetical protein